MLRVALIWAGLVSAATLNACSRQDVETARAQWNLWFEGREAKLAYGAPNTDQTPIVLSCQAGDGEVRVFADSDAGDQARVTLASGRKISELQGRAERDPLTGGYAVQATAPVDAEAFEAFSRSGKLAMVGARVSRVMAARDDDRAAVERFFDWCGADRA